MLKYFFARRYSVSGLQFEEFFHRLDSILSEKELHRTGALMGMGVAYEGTGSKVTGTVKLEATRDGVRADVSTLRRSAYTYTILAVFLMFPSLFLTAYLAKMGVIPLVISFIALVFVFGGSIIVLAYEITLGVFPGSKRVRQSIMEASDRILTSAGGAPKSDWKTVMRRVKVKERYWRRGSGPQMIDPSEFTTGP